METHSFYAIITANIKFNDEDFELIKNCMLHHYDYTVKSSAVVGGFWYGFNNVRTWAKESKKEADPDYNPYIHRLEERQIGLVLKALEMNHTPQSYDISKRLYGIIRQMHQKWDEVNAQLKPVSL